MFPNVNSSRIDGTFIGITGEASLDLVGIRSAKGLPPVRWANAELLESNYVKF